MWKRCNETCFNQEILLINRQIYTVTNTHTDRHTHTSLTHTEAAAVALVFPAADKKELQTLQAMHNESADNERTADKTHAHTHSHTRTHTQTRTGSHRKQQTAKWANWQDKRPIRTQWKGTCLMRYAIVGIQFYFFRFRFLFLHAFLRVVRICVFFFLL